MRNRLRWLPLLTTLLVAGNLRGADSADAQALARKIDQVLEKRWAAAGVEPAAAASDAEFLRRVYVDIAGRIPLAAETRAFLDDRRPDRRGRLVEQLLASPHYARHFSEVWRALLIPEAGNTLSCGCSKAPSRGGSRNAWRATRVTTPWSATW